MSSVSLNAGDTSWQDSITCDFCGKTEERKGTGVMQRVPLSISDPRVQDQRQRRTAHDALPEIEYEERAWADQRAENIWGHFRLDGDLLGEHKSMDMCPNCASVFADSALEKSRTGGWGTREEKQYGREVPQRLPDMRDENLYSAVVAANGGRTAEEQARALMTTNLSQVAELGQVVLNEERRQRSTGLGILGPSIGTRHPLPPGRCLWHDDSDYLCNQPAMAGQIYCYRHAAQESR